MTRSPQNPLHVATAVEAVVKAGNIQLAFLNTGFQISKKNTIDLVTDADLAVERMLRALIADRFSDHAVLGEEMGTAGRAASHCWVFDPIDGTTNYAHGLPIFCSSLALEVDGRSEVAAVYDPSRRELFVAERGGGAFLNGQPIHVSDAHSLLDSVVVTGFPYDVHERVAEIVGLFGAFVGQARAVRRLGSAALDMCYVAAGRMDGFWEQDLKPWDIAAGSLIVQEAGGRVTDFSGRVFSSRRPQVLATNGHIHDEMMAVAGKFLAGQAEGRGQTP
jgi:myo-inositol-1(or 4)-monophosphatase